MGALRVMLASLVALLCLVCVCASADAQHRRVRARRSHVARPVRSAVSSVDRPPRYLNRLRGARHRTFGGVGNEYLPTVAAVYNRMLRPGEFGSWRQHMSRCAQYHDDFARAADFFQIPVAFVAGIVLHESHCVANAHDWAGGRGIAQLTYTSRGAHVRPLERILHRPLRYRAIRRSRRLIPYSTHDHLLVAIMHWAVPERMTFWCKDRRGCGILGYNMNPSTFARRARVLRRVLRRAPTFAEIANTLPCITGPHGRCPREYVARVLAAGFAYQRFMDGTAQTPVSVGQGGQRALITADDVPGFNPARDRAFSTTITRR